MDDRGARAYADADSFLAGAAGAGEFGERARQFARELDRCDEESLSVQVAQSLWDEPIFAGAALDELLDGTSSESPLDADERRALLFALNHKKIFPRRASSEPEGLVEAREAVRRGVTAIYLARPDAARPPEPGVSVVGDPLSRAAFYRQLEGHEEQKRIFFDHLLRTWRDESTGHSMLGRLYQNATYRALVAMGKQVVPWLLRELAARPWYWTQALREITQAQPVKPEHKGQLPLVIADWMDWADEQQIPWR